MPVVKLIFCLERGRNFHSAGNLSNYKISNKESKILLNMNKIKKINQTSDLNSNNSFQLNLKNKKITVYHFQELSSTMDTAKEIAESGCADLTVIVADIQTKGRGRLQRTWYSSEGGLYFTIILKPDIVPSLSYRFNFAAGISLNKILKKHYNISTTLKWPNDILINQKKICGMISEMEGNSCKINYINIGIGINVNNDPTKVEPAATSIKALIKKTVSRKELLTLFLHEFEKTIKDIDKNNPVIEWKKNTTTINKHVKIVTNKEVLTGKAVDVDETGALILKGSDGSLKKVIYGDCFHQANDLKH